MITIYTRPGCAFCPTVKKFCEMKNQKYQELPAEGPDYDKLSSEHGFNVPLVTNKKGSVMMGYNPGRLAELIREENDG